MTVLPTTKKMLVAFDPKRPDASSSDFLIPWRCDGGLRLRGLKSQQNFQLGMLVFIGRSISENDLFARMIDSGAFAFQDVAATLALLRSYVEQLRSLKIGNVVRICSASDMDGTHVKLEVVPKSSSGAADI